jgi:hypothetical protein
VRIAFVFELAMGSRNAELRAFLRLFRAAGHATSDNAKARSKPQAAKDY